MTQARTTPFASPPADSATAVPVLSIEHLAAGYSSGPVVRIDAARVAGGEVLALLGRSGSGKTTALKAIAGVPLTSSGQVRIDGIAQSPTARVRLVARTIQSFPLLHWLPVRGNLELAARIRGIQLNDPDQILRLFRASHLVDRAPHTLSGGERCRASLSQAIVGSPRVLLLDEPFAGLDSWVKREVADSLFEFARQSNAAVLFVTHDLHDAVEYSNRSAILGGQAPSTIVAEVDSSDPGAIDRIRGLLAKEHASS